MPGSVTGAVRRAWKLLGCLATANPQILNPEDLDDKGKPQVHSKTEIRGITHLHHALDACVLALASTLFPRDGGLWELLVKRRLNPNEQACVRNVLPFATFTPQGNLLFDLPNNYREQIRLALAECRVVQHIPAEMHGMSVEQMAWRVENVEDGVATLSQSLREAKGSRKRKTVTEKVSKLIGLHDGKLKKNKAALVIDANWGVALDPEPQIIVYHKVFSRIKEIQDKNGGKRPRILRNGMLIRVATGTYKGLWKIFSIKDTTRDGLQLNIGKPDGTSYGKVAGLHSLCQNGLQILRPTYTGIPMETP